MEHLRLRVKAHSFLRKVFGEWVATKLTGFVSLPKEMEDYINKV